MTISAFPTPTPSRTQDPEVFDPAMAAFLDHFPTFVTEANALAVAMNLNDTTDASTSSVLIGLGTKTFTVTAGKSFQPGMYLVVADVAAPSTNSMVVQVTSYSGTTLVTDSKAVRGSGTIASWIISLSAAAADIAQDIAAATAKATPVDADKFGYWDSVSGLLRSMTWANIKTMLAGIHAALAGSASQVFSVATATAAAHAVPLFQVVGRSKYVNGAYQVSQVNVDASHTITAAAAINYGIDQWYTQCTGQNITAQRIAGTAPFRYAYKLSAGATGPTTTLHGQRIEGKNVAFLESGDVAVKVNIVGDVARTVTWTAYYATVEDTFSTKTQIATGSISATASQATYQFTFNAGANAKNGIAIEYTTGSLTNSTGYITYSGHQLESGVISTAYEHKDYGYELSECQRFLPVIKSQGIAYFVGQGGAINTASGIIGINLVASTRIPITGLVYSSASHFQLTNTSGTATTVGTVIAIAQTTTDLIRFVITGTGTPYTANTTVEVYLNTTSGFIYGTGAQL